MPQLQKTEVVVVSNSLAYKIDAKMDENNKPIIKVGNVSGGLGIGLHTFSGEEFQEELGMPPKKSGSPTKERMYGIKRSKMPLPNL